MTTLTEVVAAVVVHSSAAVFSHFGVTLETPQVSPPAAEQRVVARSPRRPDKVERVQKASTCPDVQQQRAHVQKA